MIELLIKEKEMLQLINGNSFKKKINASSKLVLVEFGADWCGACFIMEPILCQLAKEYENLITIYQLNIDTGKKIANDYGIEKLPVYLFFKKGRLLDQINGAASKATLIDKIMTLTNSN